MRANERALKQDPPHPMEVVLRCLKGVEKVGLGVFEADCPVHKGGGERLRVVEAEDGRALVECEAGCCWLDEIVPVLGLSPEDLAWVIDDFFLGSGVPLHDPLNEWEE